MGSLKLVVFSVSVAVLWSSCDALQFPSYFKFGTASAAYQIEGAWNVDGKGESIWDRFTHRVPSPIKNNETGDVACDSYDLWERDIEMVEELGVDFYRFSISWPRLLPDGFAHNISDAGKEYYNNLIDGLIAKGIEPLVTMYHWDLPQKLQDYGGWLNPMVTDLYAEYARVLFTLFGDRVKTWLTFNEPQILCDMAYNLGNFAPGIVDMDRAMYVCNKNVLLAHAKAWRIYDQEFRSTCSGRVSIANNFVCYEAATDDDEEAAELAMQYCNGRYSNPIFSSDGGWPATIETIIANNSALQGYPSSRLPAFTADEITLIQGTYDFYGINYYTRYRVSKATCNDTIGTWPKNGIPELGVLILNSTTEEIWPYSAFPIYPAGLRVSLDWIKDQYGAIETFITETGYGTPNTTLNDTDRIEFYEEYLEQVLLAIDDGCNVTGYTAWCLMDNFSWKEGFGRHFGFFYTDYSTTNYTRTARASATYFKSVIQNRTTSD